MAKKPIYYILIILGAILIALGLFFLHLKRGQTPAKHKSILGIADNAKGGAILLSNNDVIYINRLSGWNKEYLNKHLVVTGDLNTEQYLPINPNHGQEGLPQSQGADSGQQMVFRNAKWVLARNSLFYFKSLTKEASLAAVEKIIGEPDSDIGSGMHILVYKQPDSSEIWLGSADLNSLFYIKQKLSNGKIIDIL